MTRFAAKRTPSVTKKLLHSDVTYTTPLLTEKEEFLFKKKKHF